MSYWYWWPIVEDEQQTTSAGSVNLLHIWHRQNTEQYHMESSWIDFIVVGSVNENTENQWLKTFTCFMYSSTHGSSTSTSTLLPSTIEYKYLKLVLEYQVLQLWSSTLWLPIARFSIMVAYLHTQQWVNLNDKKQKSKYSHSYSLLLAQNHQLV